MKELLRTTNPTVIPYATALLQGEGIEVFDVDVHMHTLESTLGMMPRRLTGTARRPFHGKFYPA